MPPERENAAEWLSVALQESLRQLMAIQAEVESEHERQRVNARRLTTVLYLMGRVRNQLVAIPPPPVNYQLAAVRRSLRTDAALLDELGGVDEELRGALAYVVERQQRGLGSSVDGEENTSGACALTTSTLMAIATWNEWLLRQPTPPELERVLAHVAQIRRQMERRFSLFSLAPPTPEEVVAYWPLMGEDLPLPREPLPTPRAHITHEKKEAPSSEAVRLRVAPGSSICAVAEGTVAFVGPVRGLDEVVIVAHKGGRLSVYALLGETLVRSGDHVSKGTVVGRARVDASAREVPVMFEVREGEKPAPPRLLLGDEDPRRALVKD